MKKNKKIWIARARKLRKNSTDVENYVWYFLRNRRFSEYKFRRQYKIPPYIADFICLSKRLIIELDGGQHDEGKAYDEQRTSFLEARGYKVLRFWNNEVFENTEGVISAILAELTSSPSPAACKISSLTNNCAGSDLSREQLQHTNHLTSAGEVNRLEHLSRRGEST
jgi:very-short-patch-repair endonuclease